MGTLDSAWFSNLFVLFSNSWNCWKLTNFAQLRNSTLKTLFLKWLPFLEKSRNWKETKVRRSSKHQISIGRKRPCWYATSLFTYIGLKICILLYVQKQRCISIFQVSMVCVNVFFVYFKNHGWKNYLRGGETTRVYLPSKRSSTPFKKFYHGIWSHTVKVSVRYFESLVSDSWHIWVSWHKTHPGLWFWVNFFWTIKTCNWSRSCNKVFSIVRFKIRPFIIALYRGKRVTENTETLVFRLISGSGVVSLGMNE